MLNIGKELDHYFGITELETKHTFHFSKVIQFEIQDGIDYVLTEDERATGYSALLQKLLSIRKAIALVLQRTHSNGSLQGWQLKVQNQQQNFDCEFKTFKTLLIS